MRCWTPLWKLSAGTLKRCRDDVAILFWRVLCHDYLYTQIYAHFTRHNSCPKRLQISDTLSQHYQHIYHRVCVFTLHTQVAGSDDCECRPTWRTMCHSYPYKQIYALLTRHNPCTTRTTDSWHIFHYTIHMNVTSHLMLSCRITILVTPPN